jgi:hypothetical protein
LQFKAKERLPCSDNREWRPEESPGNQERAAKGQSWCGSWWRATNSFRNWRSTISFIISRLVTFGIADAFNSSDNVHHQRRFSVCWSPVSWAAK